MLRAITQTIDVLETLQKTRHARNKQVFLDELEVIVNMTGISKGKDPVTTSDSSNPEFPLGLKGIFVEPEGIR